MTTTDGNQSRDEHEDDEVQTNQWYSIDRKMLAAKVVCFLDAAKLGSVVEYSILFQVSIGLNPAHAGLMSGIQLIGALIGGPFWGFIADKKLCHRLITKILCSMSILFVCLIPCVPLFFGDHDSSTCPQTWNSTNSTYKIK